MLPSRNDTHWGQAQNAKDLETEKFLDEEQSSPALRSKNDGLPAQRVLWAINIFFFLISFGLFVVSSQRYVGDRKTLAPLSDEPFDGKSAQNSIKKSKNKLNNMTESYQRLITKHPPREKTASR